MKQVRLYSKDDLKGIRISANMPCPDCSGKAEIENPVYLLFNKSRLTLDHFNQYTGANLKGKPRQWIVCPHCEDGTIEIWFYLADLNHVFKDTANSILGNIEPAFRDALSNLDRVLQNEITELKDDLKNIDTVSYNNLAAVRSDLTQALADHYVELTNTIHNLSTDVSALHSDLTTLDKRTTELQDAISEVDKAAFESIGFSQKQIIQLRQELAQKEVIESVFGTKENDHA